MITDDELNSIANLFSVESNVVSIVPLGTGNINDTFLVTRSGPEESRFVLQKLNGFVFPDPMAVIRNHYLIDTHLEQKDPADFSGFEKRLAIPKPISTRDGSKSYQDQKGQVWRAISYVGNALSFERVRDVRHASEVGKALGRLHRLFSELAWDSLEAVIPGFHDTTRYLQKYDSIFRGRGKLTNAAEQYCHDSIMAKKPRCCVLEKAVLRGELCRHIIHGDPKISNIMMDENSRDAVGFVDLDTMGSGLYQYDVGDCLRSCCNTNGEESTIDKVAFNMEYCKAIAAGYCTEAGSILSPADLNYFYDGILQITFELGLRFFTDHLEGNPYFKTARPNHNLERAAVQFRLFKKLEEVETEVRSMFAESG